MFVKFFNTGNWQIKCKTCTTFTDIIPDLKNFGEKMSYIFNKLTNYCIFFFRTKL